MSSESAVIEVRAVSKRYEVYDRPSDRLRRMVFGRARRMLHLPAVTYAREFWALQSTSLQVDKGETLGIIGRNGSGKSTLLQLICGTLRPTSGEVVTRGRVAALLELGAGFNAEFTGEENVRLSALLYGLTERQLVERYESIVAFSELGDFIRQPVKTYSSGMYVRLAFAVAAHVDAEILIIDEALSVGDARFAQKCARFLRAFQSRGTLLFVSHDLSAVINLCSRAIWLDAGRLVMDGAAKDVVEAYLAEQHAQDRATVGAEVVRPSARLREAPRRTNEDASERVAMEQARGNEREPHSTFQTFQFDPDAATGHFGEGKLSITGVRLQAERGAPSQLLGGQVVHLEISADAREDVDNVIFGFYVKDRLGQRLFGENSYLAHVTAPPSARAGEQLVASFRFRMPVMPAGEYTVDVAVATGSQLEHTQQHWIHDALLFQSSDTTMRHGLVGIPMLDVRVHNAVLQE